MVAAGTVESANTIPPSFTDNVLLLSHIIIIVQKSENKDDRQTMTIFENYNYFYQNLSN